jgi:group II intron reverse transcriptase/maturase
MASGSYFPKPVRQTIIPKGDGKTRALGIPTIVDRVAQQVITMELEKEVDKTFSDNSFGYRPNKSAHDAVEQCRINCMRYSWVIDIDIKGFFDNIDHELLIKSVEWHINKKHILMYCKRWLNAAIQCADGTLKQPAGKGTPQGGVISPVLANIFLDVVFDKWMERHYPNVVFERYADDIVVHCQHIKEALRLLEAITVRFKTCKLELNKDKTKIVYCRRNQKNQPPFKVYYQEFDFLGFTFKPRIVKERGKLKLGFSPAISQKNISRINDEMRRLKIHCWIYFNLSKVGEFLKSKIRGWLLYYSKFRMSELRHLFRDLNKRLARWVSNKYRRFRRRHWYFAYKYLQGIAKAYPYMFEHWKVGFLP